MGMLDNAKQRAGYGKGYHAISSDLLYLDPEEVAFQTLETFRSPDYQPPVLPAVALRLLEISQGRDVETSEIVGLLEQDPLLAARIMSISNSALYGNVGQIKTIRDAVVRLGRVNLMNCVMEVSLSSRVFRVRGYENLMARVAMHSRATAHLAKIVSRYTWVTDEFAFLCGLLHDVGLSAALIALGDVPRNSDAPDLDMALVRAIDEVHAEASGILCELWGLPSEICVVVSKHHDLLVGSYPHPLASVICLAEHLANSAAVGWTGTSISTVDRSTQRAIVQAREVLRIDDIKWDLIQEESRVKLTQL